MGADLSFRENDPRQGGHDDTSDEAAAGGTLPLVMPEHDPPRSQELAARMRADAADREARDKAKRVVESWNAAIAAGQGALWSPTIRCAVIAGMPWLDVHCPGCGTSGAIDIRTIDRHPLASVGSLVLGLRCSMCPGATPMPVLHGLHTASPAAKRSETI